MAEANDAQMQQYADERVRVRAEQIRALYYACKDDKAVIDDVYARAAGANPWADARTDGPPKLLASADVLNFNAFVTNLIAFVEGTFPDLATANSGDDQWAALQDACVRPLGR